MRVISPNLNGIRSAAHKGVDARLAELSREEGGAMRGLMLRQRAPEFLEPVFSVEEV